MLRALSTLALIALALPAYAAQELPRAIGMYVAQGAPLAMVDSDIRVQMLGPIATATVTQTFRNDSDDVAEATYIFPLPPDAAVSALEIRTANRTMHAQIETRAKAEQRYEAAVAAGLGAGLLEQERPDVFTQTVSAIPGHSAVTVVLRFDTVAHYAHGTWELAIPLVVAPRYVPGSASGRPTTGTGRSPDTDRAPDASRVTPAGTPGGGGRTDVAIELDDAVDVTSPTHELTASGTTYTLSDATSDHDVVVRWRSQAPQRAWVEPDGFAAVLVEAKAPSPRTSDVRVRLVLDRSATTHGDAEGVERSVVRALLASLTTKDMVAVSGSDTLAFAAPATIASSLDERWAKSAGAFDLTKALRALGRPDAPVVLVTDGLVADDAAAVTAAEKLGTPVYVIGVGPAPNRGLLDRIAVATGGSVRYALVGDDFAALAREVIADVGSRPSPLTILWGTLRANDVVPSTLPRVGAGQAILVLAKVDDKARAANARARGDVFPFTVLSTASGRPLARRWAKRKLDELVAAGAAMDAIERHALAFGLVSPATSMVAIGDETVIEGGVKHTIPVPVSVPAGMQWQLVKKQTTVAVQDKVAGDDEDRGESMAKGEPMPTTDVALVSETAIVGWHRGYRLALAVGGGVALAAGDSAPVVALSGRFDLGHRFVLGGVEGSLWLVDGAHAQGRALATVSFAGLVRRVELAAGGGVHLTGDAAGPALGIGLRYALPWRLAGYLRYDAALLDGTAQHAITGGVETRW